MLRYHGPGLSRDVTPVANVCGKERPYKLYHIETYSAGIEPAHPVCAEL
jgi:hypothetical protein